MTWEIEALDEPDPVRRTDAETAQALRSTLTWIRTMCAIVPDAALVVTHRPPTCRFWSVIVRNQFMAGHPVTDGRISVNNGSAVPNADGTVTGAAGRVARQDRRGAHRDHGSAGTYSSRLRRRPGGGWQEWH